MSTIDELGIKWDHIHTNGFSANILAGIFELDDQRIKQADDIKQLRAAIEQRDLRIAGLDERLKAVEGKENKPDLDALVRRTATKIVTDGTLGNLDDMLYAFAAELGVKP